MTSKRRPSATLEEIRAIMADREAHPDLTITKWAEKFGIHAQTYHNMVARLKASKSPVVTTKTKKAKAQPPVISHEGAELIVAAKNAKHWNAEVERLTAALTVQGLKDIINELVSDAY